MHDRSTIISGKIIIIIISRNQNNTSLGFMDRPRAAQGGSSQRLA
jgi:hypothetical protein